VKENWLRGWEREQGDHFSGGSILPGTGVSDMRFQSSLTSAFLE